MEALVIIFVILLVAFVLTLVCVASYNVIRDELEKRAQEKADEGYIVTEYVYKGEVIYTTRVKADK